MIKMKNSLRNIVLLAAMTLALALQAQPKDKILNRPYADLKRLHFGFSVGTSFQNLSITNNGFVTDNGESWFAEVPELSPGFTVSVLADLRLNNHRVCSSVIKWCVSAMPTIPWLLLVDKM